MQAIVANVQNTKFDIEIALERQVGATPLPFPGMDKSGSAICTFHMQAMCSRGIACPFRHIKGDRTVVCKHWLRGLCKKGDDCEFLHEYDMSKMPECYFFSKFGQCGNKECPFLHIDPEQKMKDCAWYDRGFCRHGPNCKNRHVRRVMCINYMCGFCLDGPKCKYVHPQFDIPQSDPAQQAKRLTITCHKCGEQGHKAMQCKKNEGNVGQAVPPHNVHHQPPEHNFNRPRRPLEEVVCYKCGGKGHYANRCPKGFLAFLSRSVPENEHPDRQINS
ncbi:hypothetical protein CAPTEDRAFT_180092 [Capitella teleta]|uniref:Cleavage and polyadenylation specificity factor subunit 4 n=1 Tax=Capitella teleta TaxID=283909 RepID=R7TVT2_CAPTE|nr:hypothetical protein CAPTEDRAFT_180092 [Capitella teleta]|eukprot:ELT97794.1 hypothetical protein CAPTEDRAFT_180092 [Capitella teleta]